MERLEGEEQKTAAIKTRKEEQERKLLIGIEQKSNIKNPTHEKEARGDGSRMGQPSVPVDKVVLISHFEANA